jgi:hypothetical protein
MVAGILKKVIFPLTQPHARVSFSSEKDSWHVGKSHIPTYAAPRSSEFPERKGGLAF